MANACNYLANKVLDHIIGKTSFTMPANVYVALSTTAPTAAGGNVTEPAVGSYARKQTGAADWAAASAGANSNANAINFVTPTAGWGTVAYWVLYDALSGGNPLAYGTLTASRVISTGDVVQIAIGQITFSLS